jgi:peroxin-11B
MQANGIKFIALDSDTAKKISRISNRFWLAGILFSITNAILKVSRYADV